MSSSQFNKVSNDFADLFINRNLYSFIFNISSCNYIFII